VSKIRVVMEREFLSTVRRKSYLIVTFGMPFFVTVYIGLVGFLPAFFMARSEAAKKEVGIVDLAGVLRLDEAGDDSEEGDDPLNTVEGALRGAAHRAGLPAGDKEGATGGTRPADPRLRAAARLLEEMAAPVRFRSFVTRDEALAALRAKEVDRVYLLPADYLATGAVESYQAEESGLGLRRKRVGQAFERLLSRSLLAGRLPEEVRARVDRPVDPAKSPAYVVSRDGTVAPLDIVARVARLAIPGAFAMLLFMSLMTSAGYLLQGISEEKENRVIEVILSSVKPEELLFGKLFGLGAAGLLQLAVWISVASMAAGLLAAAVLAALDARLFLSCLVLFVLGFLLTGSLMTGTGALGSNARESQQFAAIWSLLTILPPAVTWMAILDEPNGWVARLLGWFPLTAPLTMMLRLGTGQVPLWDFLLAVLGLCAGVYLSVRASAALLRLGLLMYGKRPTFSEILRQLRHA
jgi:ABC-2 type transport system permease protein